MIHQQNIELSTSGHGDMHRLDERTRARSLRDHLVLVAGGTRVTDALARKCGLDAGFGHGTSGHEVASFLMRSLRERPEQ